MAEITKEMMNMNKVVARGRIVGIGSDEFGHKKLVLYCSSNGRNASGAKNGRQKQSNREVYSHIAYTEIDPEIRVHDHVMVEGHVVGYDYKNETWDKWTHVQYIVADKITRDHSELYKVFGVEGFAREDPFIKLYLSGKVTSIKEHDSGWVNLTLSIPNPKDPSRNTSIRAQYSSRMRVYDVKPKKGDYICMTALLSSIQKDANGDRKRYEDIIVNDMAILQHAERKTANPEVQKAEETDDRTNEAAFAAAAPQQEAANQEEAAAEEQKRLSFLSKFGGQM